LAAVPAAVLLADARQEVFDLLTSMADGLSQGDPEQFVQALDPALPGYQALAANVRARVAQAEVLCAFETLAQRGDATHQEVQLDWFLEITLKSDPMSLVRRREIVKCRLEKQKKKWRVTAIEPAALFAPPKVGQ